MKPRHVYRPPRRNRFLSTVIIFFGGAIFTFLVFYVIPLMRRLDQQTEDTSPDLVAAISAEPEEEYQAPEEEPPPEEEPEDPPEMEQTDDQIAVEPLDLGDLGGGVGSRVILNITPNVALSSGDLEGGGAIDQEPTMSSYFEPSIPNSVKKKLSKLGSVKVLVRGLVDERGVVVEANTSQSSGIPALDQACEKALLRCKFKPAIKGGRKAKAKVTQPYSFRSR